jgi:hypothetical protein
LYAYTPSHPDPVSLFPFFMASTSEKRKVEGACNGEKKSKKDDESWDDVLRRNVELLMPVRRLEQMRKGLYVVATQIFDVTSPLLVECMERRLLFDLPPTSAKQLREKVCNMWQFFDPEENFDFLNKAIDYLWDLSSDKSMKYTDEEKKLLPEFWAAIRQKYPSGKVYIEHALHLAHTSEDVIKDHIDHMVADNELDLHWEVCEGNRPTPSWFLKDDDL